MYLTWFCIIAVMAVILMMSFAIWNEMAELHKRINWLESILDALGDQVDIIDSGMHVQEDDWK